MAHNQSPANPLIQARHWIHRASERRSYLRTPQNSVISLPYTGDFVGQHTFGVSTPSEEDPGQGGRKAHSTFPCLSLFTSTKRFNPSNSRVLHWISSAYVQPQVTRASIIHSATLLSSRRAAASTSGKHSLRKPIKNSTSFAENHLSQLAVGVKQENHI